MLNYDKIFALHHKVTSTMYVDLCNVCEPDEIDGNLIIKYKEIPCKVDTIVPDYDYQSRTVNRSFGAYKIMLSLDYDIQKGDIFIISKLPKLRLRAGTPMIGIKHQEIMLTDRGVA